MATLREIDQDMRALEALLSEVGGEVTDEAAEAAIDKWLKENAHNLEKKIDSYATVIREAELREKERLDEADRLRALAATDASIQKRLKDRLRYFMEQGNVKEVQGRYHRVRLANNGGKQPVEITKDVREIPEDFVRVRVEPNVEVIREVLTAHPDNTLPFARLLPRGKHVRIA